MQEKEFNLLDESWIKVITPSLEQREVSLMDVIIHAHEYKNLSGEMPTQDVAMIRVLLAVALTVFYRYNAEGETADLILDESIGDDDDDDENAVLRRWKEYWNKGRFPEQAIRDYLETWRERFWLFHPEIPFWQVSALQYGTDYDVKCLFGNIKESSNEKTRHHFSMTEGEELYHLSYGEAARWLVHLNAYAVNVKTDKKAPGMGLPVGVGRLGQLGFVMINGENLFHILMLNLCAQNADKDFWGNPKPVWEQAIRMEQGCKRDKFDNLPELYTMQSRRIMLKRDKNGRLIGFRAMGGDFYSLEDDFNEPMTIWKLKKGDKKTDVRHFLPRTHNPAVHVWREFPVMLDFNSMNGKGENKEHIPGIVEWVRTLYSKRLLPANWLLTFRMIGMVYGDQMSYTYGDCVNDALTISAGLLADFSGVWRSHISEQVAKCQAVESEALNYAANKLCKLLYGTGSAKSGIKDILVSQYYFFIDSPFREWLVSIDPAIDSVEDKLVEWERQSFYYAKKVMTDYIGSLGTDVYIYREEELKNGRKRLLTIPQIMNEYLWDLRKIYIMIDNGV